MMNTDKGNTFLSKAIVICKLRKRKAEWIGYSRVFSPQLFAIFN